MDTCSLYSSKSMLAEDNPVRPRNFQAQDLTLALSFILEQHKFPENRFMPFVWPSQFQSVITLCKKLRADCCASPGTLRFQEGKKSFFWP